MGNFTVKEMSLQTAVQSSVVATGVVILPVPLVCSAYWVKVLITSNFADSRQRRLSLINFGNAANSQFWIS